MKILLTGSNGQLGHDFKKIFDKIDKSLLKLEKSVKNGGRAYAWESIFLKK